jgi:hypothetical protein
MFAQAPGGKSDAAPASNPFLLLNKAKFNTTVIPYIPVLTYLCGSGFGDLASVP